MNQAIEVPVENAVLRSLSSADRHFLLPHLEKIRLEPFNNLEDLNSDILFIEHGIVLLRSPETKIALAVVGPEGAVGVLAGIGAKSETFHPISLTEVFGYRMLASDFCRAVETLPAVRQIMSGYVAALMADVVETATNAICRTVPARVAYWLFEVSQRSRMEDFSVTHKHISTWLGVRRAGVTDAIHILEGEGAIRSTRGRIIVRDLGILNRLANKGWVVDPDQL